MTEKLPLVDQIDATGNPTIKPTRKWNFGALGAAIVTAIIPVVWPELQAQFPEIMDTWGPTIAAALAALGFAVPAYVVRNRAN